MSWVQTRGWNSNKGGKEAGMCLKNVRLGYGIGPVYDDAWTAWQNTQQHKNRSYPAGVYAPIFFSYTTTINKVRRNYGHIGVRYPDGRFWSDGRVFASVEAYEKNYAPVFVGWGESVNGVRVIQKVTQGDSEVANRTQVNNLYKAILHREGDKGGLDNYTGSNANTIVSEFLGSQEFKTHDSFVKNATKQIQDLQAALRNEQNKPPKVIEKEVEKIVTKIEKIEVPVEVIKTVEVEPSWLIKVREFINNFLKRD